MKKLGCRGWVLVLFLIPVLSYAMMPVIDVNAIIHLMKTYHQLKKQYGLLHHVYDTAQAKLAVGKHMAAELQGHYGFGKLLNSQADLKKRQWSPNTWQATLKGLAGGNPARYQQLLALYHKQHPVLTKTYYQQGASKAKATVYQQQVQGNQAAAVSATYAFNDINTHLATIHQLSSQIDHTKNTKAALDLNTRMQVAIAYVQVQMLKQLAVLNEQTVQHHASTLAAESQRAAFNRLPSIQ